MRKFHFFSILLGAILFGYLLWKIGPLALWRNISLLGWGILPFILMEGIVDVFHTFGWRRCLPEPYRQISFFHLFAIRMAGSSMNHFTPTATLGGEVTKGTLLSLSHPGSEASIGIIIGKLSYSLSQLLFVALGSIFLLGKIHLPPGAIASLCAGSGLLGAGIVSFYFVQKYGKLGFFVRWLAARRISGRLIGNAADHMTKIDNALKRFYDEHPIDLLISILWHMVGLICSVLKTWYFILFMTNGSFISAAGIWFLGTWFDFMTFAVPLGIGVQEGARVFAFKTVGFSLSLGLTYGIALRLEQVFWALIGLFLYATIVGKGRWYETQETFFDKSER